MISVIDFKNLKDVSGITRLHVHLRTCTSALNAVYFYHAGSAGTWGSSAGRTYIYCTNSLHEQFSTIIIMIIQHVQATCMSALQSYSCGTQLHFCYYAIAWHGAQLGKGVAGVYATYIIQCPRYGARRPRTHALPGYPH